MQPTRWARWAPWTGVGLVVFVVAYASRLVPVLRGGGLFGLIGYDGGVYHAAASGFAQGRWPYGDYLLLHPPGIVLALLPFALLGRLVGDPDGMAVARLAWMVLGSHSRCSWSWRCAGAASSPPWWAGWCTRLPVLPVVAVVLAVAGVGATPPCRPRTPASARGSPAGPWRAWSRTCRAA